MVLAVHPTVYRADDQRLVDLAVLPDMIDKGLVNPKTGALDPSFADWLRLLQAPDEELAIRIMNGEQILRGVVARREDRFVIALRHDTLLTVQTFKPNTETVAAAAVEPLWHALGAMEAAAFDSVLIPRDELGNLVAEFAPVDGTIPRRGRFQARLRGFGLDRQGVAILEEAATYGGQRAEIVYASPGDNGVRQQSEFAVGILDTSFGRLVSSVRRIGAGEYVKYAAGTRRAFADALDELT